LDSHLINFFCCNRYIVGTVSDPLRDFIRHIDSPYDKKTKTMPVVEIPSRMGGYPILFLSKSAPAIEKPPKHLKQYIEYKSAK